MHLSVNSIMHLCILNLGTLPIIWFGFITMSTVKTEYGIMGLVVMSVFNEPTLDVPLGDLYSKRNMRYKPGCSGEIVSRLGAKKRVQAKMC